MKRILFLMFLVIGGICTTASAAVDVQAARLSLKNYGLAYCIANQFPDKSDVRDDIGIAIGIYGFMGSGMHTILQNEDTLETLHNPYDATSDYVFAAYDKVSAGSKYTDKKVVFYACLDVYNSKEFDAFIKTQDKYIRHES
ncbi:hypothetical protein [Pseudomonas fluorescens]|uniref:hypothetical protein n=1 Tax=Pseudomonas fluorescens TaxID=294 RepID=UPI001240BC75|nr:hypothetical protein [Pseudomonas fluorescens]